MSASVPQCSFVITRGKTAGQQCKQNARVDTRDSPRPLCYRHLKREKRDEADSNPKKGGTPSPSAEEERETRPLIRIRIPSAEEEEEEEFIPENAEVFDLRSEGGEDSANYEDSEDDDETISLTSTTPIKQNPLNVAANVSHVYRKIPELHNSLPYETIKDLEPGQQMHSVKQSFARGSIAELTKYGFNLGILALEGLAQTYAGQDLSGLQKDLDPATHQSVNECLEMIAMEYCSDDEALEALTPTNKLLVIVLMAGSSRFLQNKAGKEGGVERDPLSGPSF